MDAHLIRLRAWDGKRMLYRSVFDRNWYRDDDRCVQVALPKDETTLKVDQFTGLVDKNGKDIYEGDVLIDGEACSSKRGKKFVVKWFRGGFMRKYGGYFGYSSIEKYDGDIERYCEVIGNIYQNPDLIEYEYSKEATHDA